MTLYTVDFLCKRIWVINVTASTIQAAPESVSATYECEENEPYGSPSNSVNVWILLHERLSTACNKSVQHLSWISHEILVIAGTQFINICLSCYDNILQLSILQGTLVIIQSWNLLFVFLKLGLHGNTSPSLFSESTNNHGNVTSSASACSSFIFSLLS